MRNFSKLLIIAIAFVTTVSSCSKDDSVKQLVTPSLTWSASTVNNNVLEITITISSSDELPKGTLSFEVNDTVINTYPTVKGEHSYSTNFTFSDTNSHTAVLTYSFDDGRTPITKTLRIQKSVNEVLQQSTRNSWTDI